MPNKPFKFDAGDAIILHGLVQSTQLNGRRGIVHFADVPVEENMNGMMFPRGAAAAGGNNGNDGNGNDVNGNGENERLLVRLLPPGGSSRDSSNSATANPSSFSACISIEAKHLTLDYPPGQRVRLHSLVGAKHLNGRTATVIKFQRVRGTDPVRFLVELDDIEGDEEGGTNEEAGSAVERMERKRKIEGTLNADEKLAIVGETNAWFDNKKREKNEEATVATADNNMRRSQENTADTPKRNQKKQILISPKNILHLPSTKPRPISTFTQKLIFSGTMESITQLLNESVHMPKTPHNVFSRNNGLGLLSPYPPPQHLSEGPGGMIMASAEWAAREQCAMRLWGRIHQRYYRCRAAHVNVATIKESFDATKYVKTIKKRFDSKPEIYRKFLKILHMYRKEQLGIKQVLEEVSLLFADHADLLKEFTNFLPKSDGHEEEEDVPNGRILTPFYQRLTLPSSSINHNNHSPSTIVKPRIHKVCFNPTCHAIHSPYNSSTRHLKMKCCTNCRAMTYCNQNCAQEAWEHHHSRVCGVIRQEESLLRKTGYTVGGSRRFCDYVTLTSPKREEVVDAQRMVRLCVNRIAKMDEVDRTDYFDKLKQRDQQVVVQESATNSSTTSTDNKYNQADMASLLYNLLTSAAPEVTNEILQHLEHAPPKNREVSVAIGFNTLGEDAVYGKEHVQMFANIYGCVVRYQKLGRNGIGFNEDNDNAMMVQEEEKDIVCTPNDDEIQMPNQGAVPEDVQEGFMNFINNLMPPGGAGMGMGMGMGMGGGVGVVGVEPMNDNQNAAGVGVGLGAGGNDNVAGGQGDGAPGAPAANENNDNGEAAANGPQGQVPPAGEMPPELANFLHHVMNEAGVGVGNVPNNNDADGDDNDNGEDDDNLDDNMPNIEDVADAPPENNANAGPQPQQQQGIGVAGGGGGFRFNIPGGGVAHVHIAQVNANHPLPPGMMPLPPGMMPLPPAPGMIPLMAGILPGMPVGVQPPDMMPGGMAMHAAGPIPMMGPVGGNHNGGNIVPPGMLPHMAGFNMPGMPVAQVDAGLPPGMMPHMAGVNMPGMPVGVQAAAMQVGEDGNLQPAPPGVMPGGIAMQAAGPFPMMIPVGGNHNGGNNFPPGMMPHLPGLNLGVQAAAMQVGEDGNLQPVPPGMMPGGMVMHHAAGPFPVMGQGGANNIGAVGPENGAAQAAVQNIDGMIAAEMVNRNDNAGRAEGNIVEEEAEMEEN